MTEGKIMLLKWKSSDALCNLTLEVFLREICDFFINDLISVTLYGPIVFDDLAPGYGDLDFLAVVSNNFSENIAQRLILIGSILYRHLLRKLVMNLKPLLRI